MVIQREDFLMINQTIKMLDVWIWCWNTRFLEVTPGFYTQLHEGAPRPITGAFRRVRTTQGS